MGGPLPTSRWHHQPNHAYRREKSHGGYVIPIIDKKKVRVETENGRRPRGSYEPRVAKNVLPNEKPLVDCLFDLRKCDLAAMEAARKVRGMREARHGSLKLFKNHWRTCAIVGNSGAMLHGNYGSFIDTHDVVVRINILPTDKIHKHVGVKTTHRVLSNKVAREVCCERRYVPENAHVAFLMWFPAGRELLLERMKHHWPTHPAIYMHGAFLASIVGVFKAFRTELQRLGFGPFDSWEFMTSGMHAVLSFIRSCDVVDVYGFTTESSGHAYWFTGRAKPPPSGQRQHSWGQERMVLRLLYAAGHINICT